MDGYSPAPDVVDGNEVPFPLPPRARRQLLQRRNFLEDGA